MSSPPDKPAEVQLDAWRAMIYATDRLMNRLGDELMAEHGLEMSWYEAMLHIAEAGGSITQRELQGRTLLSQSGVSRVLAKMEAAGLLRRAAGETDRRTLHVELTTLGRERLRRAAPTHLAGIRRWFADRLTARQAEALRAGLGKVVRGLDEDVPLTAQGGAADRKERAAIGPTNTSLTPEPIAVGDAIVVREALEPIVVADAANYANTADLTDLRRLLSTTTARVEDPIGFLRAGWALHRRICEISPNDALRQTYRRQLEVLESNVDAVLPLEGLDEYLQARLQLHARLVRAIENGDPDTAREIAAEHRLTTAR